VLVMRELKAATCMASYLSAAAKMTRACQSVARRVAAAPLWKG